MGRDDDRLHGGPRRHGRGPRASLGRALTAALALGAGCAEPAPRAAPADEAATAPGDAAGEAAGPAYVARGPRPILEPATVGVGEPVPDVPVTDLDGGRASLEARRGDAPALVVLFTSIECPVTRNYNPVIAERLAPYRARGVEVLVVDPNLQDGADELRALAERLGWDFPVTQDVDYALTEALGARRSADAFVIDGEGVLRYRGAIDDQFGINYRLPEPRRRLLLDALDAVLAGEAVAVPATTAPGCLLAKVRRG